MRDVEREQLVRFAIGRIFRLASRAEQPGDGAEYERCRGIVLDNVQAPPVGWQPNYARDRKSGAQGD